MNNPVIGRAKEIRIMQGLKESPKSEFLAVYVGGA